MRKTAAVQKTCYEVGGLEVHVDTHQVLRNGKEIALSSKEFALLRYMVQNEGIVLSRGKNWSSIFGIMIIWAALTWWMYISGICERRLTKDLNPKTDPYRAGSRICAEGKWMKKVSLKVKLTLLYTACMDFCHWIHLCGFVFNQ